MSLLGLLARASSTISSAFASSPPGSTLPCKVEDCTGRGFASPALLKKLVSDMKGDLLKNWSTLSPNERFEKAKALMDKRFDELNIPKPTITRSKDAAAGYNDPPTLYGQARDSSWSMELNGFLFEKDPLTKHEQKELAKTLAHESRHLEQYYRSAQYRASSGDDATAITTKDTATHKPMPIPQKVADAAAADPLPKQDAKGKACKVIQKAKAWNDAKYGKGNLSQYRPSVKYKDRPLEKDAFALEGHIDKAW